LKNLGMATRITSLWRLLAETVAQWKRFGEWKPAAVFSMGGYVAGPPVLAALLRGVPIVIMEPNAVPGATNRWIASRVKRALISFEETARYFPKGRTEVTGLPVREEFFRIGQKREEAEFTVLITGGSQGSRTLNEAARQSWPLFREAGLPVRLLHQTGLPTYESLAAEFAATGLAGEVSAFVEDMPAAFSRADLIVCRAGAGAVSELAAAGKPSVLIPFPFAADDHQLRNAQVFERAGAALLSLDRDWNGRTFADVVTRLYEDRAKLAEMGRNAKKLARRPEDGTAAARAAAILIEEAAKTD
jgi:UDP-N-acetylglucosamine--N-acetylmuramyl-(pentapeptide) pyrophosphoryl-undecaprenol N-acetylglucosamine transferase